MQQTKDEMIISLYGLRAGLSSISQCCDAVKQKEDNNNHLQYEINEARKKMQDAPNFIQEKNGEIEELKRDVRKVRQDIINDLDKVTNNKPKLKLFGADILLYCFGAFMLGWMLTIFILMMKYGCAANDKDVPFSVPLVGLIGALVVVLICFSFCLTANIRKYKIALKKWRGELYNAQIEYNKNMNKVSMQEARLPGLIKYLDNYQAMCTEDYNKTNEDNLKAISANKEFISVETKKAQIIYEGLRTIYDKIINEVDYGNLDLIIYYLSTGRADSMKEALIQATDQRRHEEIIDAIENAARYISQELRVGLRNLGEGMAKCFNLLSNQIAAQHNRIMSSLEDIKENQKNANGIYGKLLQQNSELISEVQLQNALQEKANLGCEQLKSDLEFMQYRMGLDY